MNLLKKNKKFIYILILVFLASFVFYGLSTSGKLMRKTASSYLSRYNLEDIKLVSSHGIGNEEMELIKKDGDIDSLNVGYLIDANIKEDNSIVSIESLPESWIKYELIDGNLPKASGEIALDIKNEETSFKIGDQISLEQNSDNPTLRLKRDDYTIVGFIKSPEYLSKNEKAISPLSSSKLDGFALIMPEDFDMINPNFVEIHLSTSKKLSSFSDDYKAIIDYKVFSLRESLKDMPEKKAVLVKEQAKERIESSKKKSEVLKLSTANLEAKLSNKKADLDKQEKEYNQIKNEFDSKLKKSEDDLKNGDSKILALKKEIEDAEKKLEDIKPELDQQTSQVDNIKAKIEEKNNELNSQKYEIEESINSLNAEISSNNNSIAYNNSEISRLNTAISSLKTQKLLFFTNKRDIDSKISAIQGQISSLESSNNYYYSRNSELQAEIVNQRQKLNAFSDLEAEIASLENQLKEEGGKLDKISADYNKNTNSISKAKDDIEQKKKDISEADNFIKNEKVGLENKVKEESKKLENLKTSYENDNKDDIKKLERDKKEIEILARIIKRSQDELDGNISPSYSVMSFTENSGMKSYYNTTKRLDSISLIFPLVFLLACLSMVSSMSCDLNKESKKENTTGQEKKLTLKIFNDAHIKACSYLAISSILGCLTAYLVLSKLIFKLYSQNFYLNKSVFAISPIEILICLGLSLLAFLAPSLNFKNKAKENKTESYQEEEKIEKFAITKTIKENKIKVISLSLALILTASALTLALVTRRSIYDIGYKQYNSIFKYHALAEMQADYVKNKESDFDYFLNDIKNARVVMDASLINSKTLKENLPSVEFTLLIPKTEEKLNQVITLKDLNGKDIKLEDDSLIITDKLANILKLKEGDDFTFTTDGASKYSLKISGITNNYIGNFAYITNKTALSLTDKEIEFTNKFIVLKDSSSYASNSFKKDAENFKSLKNLSMTREEEKTINELIKPLYSLSLAYIGLSALLLILLIIKLRLAEKKFVEESLERESFRLDPENLRKAMILKTTKLFIFLTILGVGLGLALFKLLALNRVLDQIKLLSFLNPIDSIIVFSVFTILNWFTGIVRSFKKETN